jgi:hypothetical protein
MTPAERQRKRRARLAASRPPSVADLEHAAALASLRAEIAGRDERILLLEIARDSLLAGRDERIRLLELEIDSLQAEHADHCRGLELEIDSLRMLPPGDSRDPPIDL